MCNRIFIVQKYTGNDSKYNKYNPSELVDLYELQKKMKESHFCEIIQSALNVHNFPTH